MKNNGFRRIMLVAAVLLIVMFLLAGCTQKSGESEVAEAVKDANQSDVDNNDQAGTNEVTFEKTVEDFDYEEFLSAMSPSKDYSPAVGIPIVKIDIKGGESIVLELYPEIAPNTVNNFLALSRSGFYDGLIFHRVMKDFMIQGGDPLGTGGGNPGYSIDGEFSNNGFDNDLSHTPGLISMARSRDFNSAGSQFFIVHGDATFLDGDYAGFGKVIYGFEEVDRIANVDVKKEKPDEDVVMESIRVDLNGYEFVEPVVNQ
jgi:peptidyl-prolyl cis-trans isomerase B (cyclophilin B)